MLTIQEFPDSDAASVQIEEFPAIEEFQDEPQGSSLARDILTANQSALDLASTADSMTRTGLAAREQLLEKPEPWPGAEELRQAPMMTTVQGERGVPVPMGAYDQPPEVRREETAQRFMEPPIQFPKFQGAPSWFEKALTLVNPETLPAAIAFGPEKVAQAKRSAVNAGTGLLEFAGSPAGLLTLPLASGVLGKTVATLTKLGFSADMAKSAGEQAGSLVGEWDNLSELDRVDRLVHLGFTGALAASLAKHTSAEAARTIADKVESDAVVLARQLADEAGRAKLPMPETPEAQRRLGIRVTTEPFLQPGIPELAEQALRATQLPFGSIRKAAFDPALEQLRREINPPRMVEAPRTLAERTREAGETVGRPSVEGLRVEPGFERSASDFLLDFLP